MAIVEKEVTTRVEIDVEIFCTCGSKVSATTNKHLSENEQKIELIADPCEKCILVEREHAAESALIEMQERVTKLGEELFDERIKLLITTALYPPYS